MHDSKTCPSKQKHDIKVFQTWAFTSSEENLLRIRQHTQSLQLANNWTINKINPVSSLAIHYWSIFKGSDFESTGCYHYMDKLLYTAGVLMKTDQMFIQQWNKEGAQHWKMKAYLCLQTRECSSRPQRPDASPYKAQLLLQSTETQRCLWEEDGEFPLIQTESMQQAHHRLDAQHPGFLHMNLTRGWRTSLGVLILPL